MRFGVWSWKRRERSLISRAAGISLLVCGVIALAGCQSASGGNGTPAQLGTPTSIPALRIVTPTPGQPGSAATNPTAASTVGAASNPANNGQNGTYTVQPGDTLYVIAVRFNVTIQALMQANSISDPTTLRAGQVLVIP